MKNLNHEGPKTRSCLSLRAALRAFVASWFNLYELDVSV